MSQFVPPGYGLVPQFVPPGYGHPGFTPVFPAPPFAAMRPGVPGVPGMLSPGLMPVNVGGTPFAALSPDGAPPVGVVPASEPPLRAARRRAARRRAARRRTRLRRGSFDAAPRARAQRRRHG